MKDNTKHIRKNTILTKKINNIVYELMVMTNSDMVYVDPTYTETLTERLSNLAILISTDSEHITNLEYKYRTLVDDSPEHFRTFKEVWDYVNVNGDPKSELLKLIDSKQDKEDGKGLSTNDFTDILRDKLVNDYTKTQLDEKFAEFVSEFNDIRNDLLYVTSKVDSAIETVSEAVEIVNQMRTEVDKALDDVDKATTKVNELSDKVDVMATEVDRAVQTVETYEERLDNVEVKTDSSESISPDGTNVKKSSIWYKVIE